MLNGKKFQSVLATVVASLKVSDKVMKVLAIGATIIAAVAVIVLHGVVSVFFGVIALGTVATILRARSDKPGSGDLRWSLFWTGLLSWSTAALAAMAASIFAEWPWCGVQSTGLVFAAIGSGMMGIYFFIQQPLFLTAEELKETLQEAREDFRKIADDITRTRVSE